MTAAARARRNERQQLYPHVRKYLETRSALRFVSSPGKLSSTARQICRNLSAAKLRHDRGIHAFSQADA